MEEMITIQYSSFTALGKQVRVLVQSTSHSNWVTKHSLRFQLFLDALRKINANWSVIHRQGWGLFLLECLFHTAASMRQKERQQQRKHHSCSHHLEMAEEMAQIHPSVRSLLGSSEEDDLENH